MSAGGADIHQRCRPTSIDGATRTTNPSRPTAATPRSNNAVSSASRPPDRAATATVAPGRSALARSIRSTSVRLDAFFAFFALFAPSRSSYFSSRRPVAGMPSSLYGALSSRPGAARRSGTRARCSASSGRSRARTSDARRSGRSADLPGSRALSSSAVMGGAPNTGSSARSTRSKNLVNELPSGGLASSRAMRPMVRPLPAPAPDPRSCAIGWSPCSRMPRTAPSRSSPGPAAASAPRSPSGSRPTDTTWCSPTVIARADAAEVVRACARHPVHACCCCASTSPTSKPRRRWCRRRSTASAPITGLVNNAGHHRAHRRIPRRHDRGIRPGLPRQRAGAHRADAGRHRAHGHGSRRRGRLHRQHLLGRGDHRRPEHLHPVRHEQGGAQRPHDRYVEGVRPRRHASEHRVARHHPNRDPCRGGTAERTR